jgi:hypothetical protein
MNPGCVRRDIRLCDSKGNELGTPVGHGFMYDGGDAASRAKAVQLGPWRLDASTLVLHAGDYDIRLYECHSAAEVLDWIAQIAGKTLEKSGLGRYVTSVTPECAVWVGLTWNVEARWNGVSTGNLNSRPALGT